MDEFRTHVGLSHLAESTRYCNYSKDKFNHELSFVIPDWVNTNCPNKEQEGPSNTSIEWSDACYEAERHYLSLLKNGCTPQQARDVLPLSVKSELISCGFEDSWINFIKRRSPKYGDHGAHPMAAEIADKLGEEFAKRNIKI